jgi:hypothetical protein
MAKRVQITKSDRNRQGVGETHQKIRQEAPCLSEGRNAASAYEDSIRVLYFNI